MGPKKEDFKTEGISERDMTIRKLTFLKVKWGKAKLKIYPIRSQKAQYIVVRGPSIILMYNLPRYFLSLDRISC